MMRALLGSLLLLATVLAGCSGDDGAGSVGAASCDGITRTGLSLSDASHTVIALATSQGCIVAELYDDKAPITAANFRTYAEEGFFGNTLIHRISKDFVVQGGGVDAATESYKQTTHPAIKNEAKTSGLKNLAYTFSMARTNAPDSATSQFFINVVDNAGLDPGGFSPDGYAAFATVVQGRDVVDAIHGLPVTLSSAHPYCIGLEDRSGGSCPVDPVAIHSARVVA